MSTWLVVKCDGCGEEARELHGMQFPKDWMSRMVFDGGKIKFQPHACSVSCLKKAFEKYAQIVGDDEEGPDGEAPVS